LEYQHGCKGSILILHNSLILIKKHIMPNNQAESLRCTTGEGVDDRSMNYCTDLSTDIVEKNKTWRPLQKREAIESELPAGWRKKLAIIHNQLVIC